MGEKLIIMSTRDMCSAKREKMLHLWVGLEFRIRLGSRYALGYLLGLGFGLGPVQGLDLKSGHKGGKSDVT